MFKSLGELFYKINNLEDNINKYKNCITKSELTEDNTKDLINVIYDNITEYNNLKLSFYEYIKNVTVVLDEDSGEEISLSNAITIRKILLEKLKVLDEILCKDVFNLNVDNVIKTKKSINNSLLKIDSIINNKLWGIEIDN